MSSNLSPSHHLLFLPGSGADPNFWKPVGDRMPAAWKRSYLGWPGIGHNPPDAEVQSFDDLTRLAERKLLEVAQPASAVDVLAHSMAGAIALELALRHPALVRRIVLTATSGGLPVETWGAIDWRPGYRAEYPHAAEWLYVARPDYTARLHEVKQPTLLIWGDDDPISPPAVGAELQRRLPQASMQILLGGTHAFPLERPDEVATLVRFHLSVETERRDGG